MKELPNRVRKMIGAPLKFLRRIRNEEGQDYTTMVPAELQEMVSETVAVWLRC